MTPARESDLFRLLDDLGIAHRTLRHPAIFTADQAKTLRGDLPGAHCKSLFLKDKKGRVALALILAERTADLKGLARALGLGRLSFGSAERLRETLGVEPGSVTPFALINRPCPEPADPFTVVLDQAMLAHDPVNFHPLHNEATTAVSPNGLVAFIRHMGYEPTVLDFDSLG